MSFHILVCLYTIKTCFSQFWSLEDQAHVCRIDSEGSCPGRPHVVERELTCPSCQGHYSHLGCLHPYDLKALSPNTITLRLGFQLRIWRTGVKCSSATILLLHLSQRDCIYLQDCFFTPVYYKLNLFSSVQYMYTDGQYQNRSFPQYCFSST